MQQLGMLALRHGRGTVEGSVTHIVSGEDIFNLTDSHGLPLDTIQDLLAEKGWAMDVVGFARAALASGNYTPERLIAKLEACAPPSVPPGLIRAAVERAIPK